MRIVVVVAWLGACIPEDEDFLLVPSVVDASGEATTAAPGSVTVRTTVVWENGERAPETLVTVDARVSVEDDETQDFLGRLQLDRTSDFDNSLGPGERAEVTYAGTQSPPVAPLDPAVLCDGRSVHLQVLYSTHGSLVDSPKTSLSNGFLFDCD